MPPRSSLTVTFRGKEYVGEYEIEGATLRVFFNGSSKARRLKGSNPEFLARLLLIELISRV